MIVNKRFDDPDKRQEDDPQDAKDVFRDLTLTCLKLKTLRLSHRSTII